MIAATRRKKTTVTHGIFSRAFCQIRPLSLFTYLFFWPPSHSKRGSFVRRVSLFFFGPLNRRDYQRPRYPSLPSFSSSPSSSIEGTKCHLGVLSYGEGIARLLAAALLLQQTTWERGIFGKGQVQVTIKWLVEFLANGGPRWPSSGW